MVTGMGAISGCCGWMISGASYIPGTLALSGSPLALVLRPRDTPLALFYAVFKPAIVLLNGLANWLLKRVFRLEPVAESELAHSEEELRLIVDESAKSAHISPLSHEIVDNAFDMRLRLVREVMTPRGKVVYLDVNLPFRENLARAKAARHTRFPSARSTSTTPSA